MKEVRNQETGIRGAERLLTGACAGANSLQQPPRSRQLSKIMRLSIRHIEIVDILKVSVLFEAHRTLFNTQSSRLKVQCMQRRLLSIHLEE